MEEFYFLLFEQLIINCPTDSYNMVSHIVMEDYGDSFVISISGPTKRGYDYAAVVNGGRKDRAPIGREVRNIAWIERTVQQVAEAMGVKVEYDLS